MGGSSELRDAEIGRLVQHVAAPGATEPFGAYLFRTDEVGAELGRYVERSVFFEAFGNSPELLGEEYGRYETASAFICIVDHLRNRPAGMMRILLPSPVGFKSLNDIEPVWGESPELLMSRTGIVLPPESTWDIATLAVSADYRGKASTGLVSMGLYQTLGMVAPRCGIDWLVAILDAVVHRILRKLKMPFAGFKGIGPLPYLGSSASLPVWCNIAEMKTHLAVSDPDLHAAYFEGVGLEPAIRPIDIEIVESLVA